MNVALINPQIIQWAIERNGSKPATFSDKLDDWLIGSKKPTFRQAQKLANALHIPFGYLYLDEPPSEESLIPDLRTLNDSISIPHRWSMELRDIVIDAMSKQDWYRDYLIASGQEPLEFINKYSVDSSITFIADDITQVLKLNIEDRTKFSNWEDFFRKLLIKTEEAGILVLCNGKVAYNTKRILQVEEFRGFAIPDNYAPLVFINSADAKTAQIFTLIHELAHVWIGESGISDLSVFPASNVSGKKIEQVCNAVAAEVLTPSKAFRGNWNDALTLEQNSDALKNYFKVSTIVIARRALDLDIISPQNFFNYYNEQKEHWKKKKSDGGNFYKSFPIINSRKFTTCVLHQVYSEKLLMRDGARLLNTKPAMLDKYVEKENVFEISS